MNPNNDPERTDGASEPVGDLVRIFRRKNVWYANYQVNHKQCRQSLKTRSKKEARQRALRLEAELLQGRFPRATPPPAIEAVVKDYVQFLVTEQRAAKTIVKYKAVFERVTDLAKRRHARSILDVDLKFVDAYRTSRAQAGAAAKTLFTETVIVRQLVNFALSRGLIAADPLKGFRIRKPKPNPQPCWTRAEVEKILHASREPQRAAFTLLAETGMRVGELRHLTWEDIDFGQGLIYIRPKPAFGWKPKSGDQRAVPMSPTARQVLESLPRCHCWVVTAGPSNRFPKGGGQVSERRLLASLKRVLEKVGLKGHLGPPQGS